MNTSHQSRSGFRRPILVALGLPAALAIGLAGSTAAYAAAPTDGDILGLASGYAVLGGSTVTNDGAGTDITGDVGLSPGTAITGLLAEQVHGTIHTTDADAADAQLASQAGYTFLQNKGATGTEADGDLGGSDLGPGVYDNIAQIDGKLTLTGGADDVWIFQSPSALTAMVGSEVELAGEASACNVYWQVTSSATLNGASFVGNVFALTSISVGTNAPVTGRLLAQSGAVTLLNNVISAPDCGTVDDGGAPADDGSGTDDGTPTDGGSADGGTEGDGTGTGTDASGGGTTTTVEDSTAGGTLLAETGIDGGLMIGSAGLLVLTGGVLLVARRRIANS
ncbi:MAG: hypothetical protein JWR33_987 [Naasia sp.]|jgi:hypothetical protein|uniref:ice-binding family protein n=1 Tax=Naasia sp. TaxID=2546198 RepID=UPI002611658E|nr:ice-binding family protein [Naasia sp.]MCU1570246.1 hypothetical protein [Naasia sp.]